MNKKIKLLIISSRFYPAQGGVEVVIKQLVKYLEPKKNLDIRLLGNIYREERTGLSGLKSFIKRMMCKPFEHIKAVLGIGTYYYGCSETEKLNVKIAESYMWGLGVSKIKLILAPLIMPWTILHFLYLMIVINPDVINVHFLDDSVFYALLAKKIFKKKVVVSIHGSGILVFAKRNWIHKYLVIKLLSSADWISVVSSELKEKIIEMANINSKKITVIGNGVDKLWFNISANICANTSAKIQSLVKNSPMFILFYGRLEKVKGVDVLIKAFSKFVMKFPKYKLIIVGDGNEKDKLMKLVQEKKLVEQVYFPGFVKHDAIQCLLKKAQFVVFPSRREGSPVAISECLATGTPIITTKVGAIPDMIKSGKNGLLIEVDDINGLMRKMEKLTNKNLQKKLSQNEKLYAMKNRRIELIINQYANLYEKVFASK